MRQGGTSRWLMGMSLVATCLALALPTAALGDWQGSGRLVQRLSADHDKVQGRLARPRQKARRAPKSVRRRGGSALSEARPAFGSFLATPFGTRSAASSSTATPGSPSPPSAPASAGGPGDLIGDPNDMLNSRLSSLTENVPNVPQPNWSQMPVYQGTFGAGHMGGWTGDNPSVAAGGGRLYIANPDMWRVDMYDATTRAFVGKFGEAPGSCTQTAMLCVPTGITYYHGKVYVVDDSARVFVFNASGGFVRQLQMPLDISGIDAAWGELWITSQWGLGDLGQSFVNEHAQTVYVLDADTLVLKGVLEHPAAPWAIAASEPSFSSFGGTPIQKWDTRWSDIAIAPEVGAVYAGYRSIARGALPLSTPVSDPLAQCSSGCDATALFEKGADAVWGMRWLMATTGYDDGECSHCVTSQSWINEYSLDSALSALPSLNRRRRWQPATANNRTSQLDTHYLNREVRIDWDGALTKPDWINGNQSLTYIVSDADIFVVGDQAEHWYELARDFSRVELAVDGSVKASSTLAQGSFTLDTNAFPSGVHTLTLTAYLTDGSKVISTNSSFRIDRDAPNATLADPGSYASGTVAVSGTATDTHAGPRDWTLQALPSGQDWRDVCADPEPIPGSSDYGCGWVTGTGQYPDGSYRVRARARDLVNSRITNVGYSPERVIVVDNTSPTMSLTGDLRDAADHRPLTAGEEPTLQVAAGDAGSGVRSVEVLVDEVRRDFVEQGCEGGGCSLNRTFTLRPADHADGTHTVRVVVADHAGRTTATEWTIDVEAILPAAEDQAGAAALTASTAIPPIGSTRLIPEVSAPADVRSLPRFTSAAPDEYMVPCASDSDPANFPVWSLGSSFEALSVSTTVRRCDPAPSPVEPIRSNWVSYVYGSCSPDAGEDDNASCLPPLVVQSWPACERSLWSYDLGPEAFRISYVRTELRGVPGAIFGDDGLRVEVFTGTSTIVLFGHDRNQLLRAVAALRPEPSQGDLGSLPPPLPVGDLPPPLSGALAGALPCTT